MGARGPERALIGCAVCTSSDGQGTLVLAMAHDVALMAIQCIPARILQRTDPLAVVPLERSQLTATIATRGAR